MTLQKSFTPADLFAFLLIIGYFVLQWKGVEVMIPQAILIIIGFYFGHNTSSTTVLPPQ
jgi:uncharacterized protein (TIGR02594 family)